MKSEDIQRLLQTYRRDFHRYPEEGWLTFRTSILVAERMEQLGFDVSIGEEIVPADRAVCPPGEEEIRAARERCRSELGEAEEHRGLWEKWEKRMGNLGGVIAVFDTGRPGPTVACRFDIDALPLTESEDPGRVPVREGFTSLHSGLFHGCGHDGHTAIGLVCAMRLAEREDELRGRMIFIFQPAEEGVRGARSYCADWKFGRIDYFLTSHIGFTESDTFVAGAVKLLAVTDTDGEFIGKSAHSGAAPERGKNALLALAEAIVKMQEIPKPESGVVRLNVGTLQAGETRNTIPAHAVFAMETRGSDNDLARYMQESAERILSESAEKYGVKCNLTVIGGAESADSDDELSLTVQAVARECGAYQTCVTHQTFGASDDAAAFMNMTQQDRGQAVYMLLGCPINGRHHEEIFDFDESVLGKGCDIYFEAILKLLK